MDAICVGLIALALNFLIMFIAIGLLGEDGLQDLAEIIEETPEAVVGAWHVLVVAMFSYIFVIALAFVFSQIFLIRPILRRKVEGMQNFNISGLEASQQRDHDEAAEAGGFADALGVDVGAGF